MTEQVDLDALIAVLRKGDGNGCRQPTEAMRTAAEHLDELRQERELADKYQDLTRRTELQCQDAEAALSRAEETIEKALGATDMSGEWIVWDSGEAYDILTEYDKQKGAAS